METLQKIVYELEQKFPSSKAAKLSWYEMGEDYETESLALERLKELKYSGKSGFRVVKKTISLEIIKTI